MDTFLEVLKWIGIVVAVGFVGYFGRYLAMFVIEKLQRKKPDSSPAASPAVEPQDSPEVQLVESRLKLEKKKAKAEAKKAKKAEK